MGCLTLVRSQRNYAKLHLRGNPFPYAGIPDENPSFCADRDKELASISETLLACLEGHSTHLVLLGGYGNGKTHALKYLRSEVNRQLNGKGAPKAVASFVITPGASFLDLYRSFMQDLGLNFFVDCAWHLTGTVGVLEFQRKRKLFQSLTREDRERIRNKPQIIREYVEDGTVLLSALTTACRRKLFSIVRSTDVANAFFQLTTDETALLAWKWMSGDQTAHEQRKEIGIVSALSTDEKALSIFLDVRSILRQLGYSVLCLLIDEFENVETLFPQQKQRFLNSIRHLIDLNPTGLCLIVSCTPEVWKTIVREYHAFSERIFREVILRPLNEESLGNLIVEYLQRQRTTPKDDIGRLHPFSDDCVRLILESSQGNMRRALSLCNLSIDAAVEAELVTITGDYAKNVISRKES